MFALFRSHETTLGKVGAVASPREPKHAGFEQSQRDYSTHESVIFS